MNTDSLCSPQCCRHHSDGHDPRAETEDPVAKRLIISLLAHAWGKQAWKFHDAELLSVFLSRATSGNVAVKHWALPTLPKPTNFLCTNYPVDLICGLWEASYIPVKQSIQGEGAKSLPNLLQVPEGQVKCKPDPVLRNRLACQVL